MKDYIYLYYSIELSRECYLDIYKEGSRGIKNISICKSHIQILEITKNIRYI